MDPAFLPAALTSHLLCARLQMAFTLGFHIVFACLGVGLPVLLLAAEGLYLRTGDPGWKTLARRWSKAFAVLFALGAVSGTVLSFELGLLWPEFMGRFGSAIGLPFTLEAFAFFVEAIFVGIYLYTWDRLSPRAHWASCFPIALAGLVSACVVVTANAWMNTPVGFRLEHGRLVEADPWAAMFNPAAPAQVLHMALAAYMVTGFTVAAYYAVTRLRGDDRPHTRRALALGLALGVIATFPQMAAGDWAAKTVARTQPVKFAAMEGQFRTEAGAPLRLGGVPDEDARTTRYALEIPGGLSWLSTGDRAGLVHGLDAFPREDQPPVGIVHGAFQAMVGSGGILFLLSLCVAVSALRRRRLPEGRWFLRTVAAAGPLAVLAMEAGWIVTEVGRQPWIVSGVMRTSEAVTAAPGVEWTLAGAVGIYAVLTGGALLVLNRLARLPLSGGTHAP